MILEIKSVGWAAMGILNGESPQRLHTRMNKISRKAFAKSGIEIFLSLDLG